METEFVVLIILAIIFAFSFIVSIGREYKREKNFIYIHTKTGNKYRLYQDCLMKYNGKWMEAVIYTKEESGELYVREHNDFISNFKILEEWEKEKK